MNRDSIILIYKTQIKIKHKLSMMKIIQTIFNTSGINSNLLTSDSISQEGHL